MTVRKLSLPINLNNWKGTLKRWAAELTRLSIFGPEAFEWKPWSPIVTGGTITNPATIYAEYMVPEGTDTCFFTADVTFTIGGGAGPGVLYITLPRSAVTGSRANFIASGFNPAGARLPARGVIPVTNLSVAEVALDNLALWALGANGLTISGVYKIEK